MLSQVRRSLRVVAYTLQAGLHWTCSGLLYRGIIRTFLADFFHLPGVTDESAVICERESQMLLLELPYVFSALIPSRHLIMGVIALLVSL